MLSSRRGATSVNANSKDERVSDITRDLTEHAAVLAEAGLNLMACHTDDDVFDVARDFLSDLLPGVIVVVSKATPDDLQLFVRDVLGMDETMVEQASSLVGAEIRGWSAPVGPLRSYFAKRSLVKMSGGLGELSPETPPGVAVAATEAFGLRGVYTIGIADERTIFGAIHVLTREGDPILPAHVIEAFVYECFLTLSNMSNERALRQSEEMYRSLTEGMKDVAWTLDPQTLRFLYVSPSVLGLRGYTAEEVMAEPMDAALTAEGSAQVRARLAERIGDNPTPETLDAGFHIEEIEQPCKDGSTVWTEVITRYLISASTGRVEVHGVTRDITRRKRAETALVESKKRIERLLYGVAEAMGRAVEARDPYTQGHEVRVARLATALACEMGAPDEYVAGVELAALVHDIGKLSVPAEILNKPGALSENEFSLIRRHSQAGYEILKGIDFPWPVAEAVMQHHERMDGSGYPDGLFGDAIGVMARIIAVADVVEAMASHRPYRPALGIEAAVEEIAGHPEQFDPGVTAACIRLHESGRLVW